MNFSQYENELSRFLFVFRFTIFDRIKMNLHRYVLYDVVLTVDNCNN